MSDITRTFKGRWITNREFAPQTALNVFHRQLEKVTFPEDLPKNKHILFRKRFQFKKVAPATIYISADDYYKLYINGKPVTLGPCPGYSFHYYYNAVDVTDYLNDGENVIAVHTLYQGLINRVWVSGDMQHGLILDLVSGGETILSSDESFLTHEHTGFSACGISGYQTQIMQRYDSAAPETGFERPDFDDSAWENACVREHHDYRLFEQPSKLLEIETIAPIQTVRNGNTVFFDFGKMYVGYIYAEAKGEKGSEIIIRAGQELNDDGSVRYKLRCNCLYEEFWRLSGECDSLNEYDYKTFRYAELVLPEGCTLDTDSVRLMARHYPFDLTVKPESDNEKLLSIWELAVHSLKYGVQEEIQDSMDREKGQYLGDGCYTAMAHMLLSGDSAIAVKLIDDSLRSGFVNKGLMTCSTCSLMQEIAEYPLIMPLLQLAYHHMTGDTEKLRQWYRPTVEMLEFYREQYEREDHLLYDLDKWCVVEWPKEYQDGYDHNVTEGHVCLGTHNVINAYYIAAVKMVNRMAELIGETPYRDISPLTEAFVKAFYLPDQHLFRDTPESSHISMPGNMIAFFAGILPDEKTQDSMIALIQKKGLTSCMFFITFPMLCALKRIGRDDLIESLILDEGGWLRSIREGATATIEGWGKDTKWNTSLFHLTMSDVCLFLTEWNMQTLLSSY